MKKLNPFNYEHLFSYSCSIYPNMELIKNAPFGMRCHGYISGGEVWGPKFNGKLRPVGGDWSVVSPNGVVNLDVRATLESNDGAIVYMRYGGRMDLGSPQGYEDYKAEKFPPKSYINIMPILETDHPDYEWMNRVSCFGIGRVDFTADPVIVQYDVYAFHSLAD